MAGWYVAHSMLTPTGHLLGDGVQLVRVSEVPSGGWSLSQRQDRGIGDFLHATQPELRGADVCVIPEPAPELFALRPYVPAVAEWGRPYRSGPSFKSSRLEFRDEWTSIVYSEQPFEDGGATWIPFEQVIARLLLP